MIEKQNIAGGTCQRTADMNVGSQKGFTFQRVEKKYLLTEEKYGRLQERLKPYMQLDQYGRHTICNIYYDTEQFELIRGSIEKPPYKEKLRLRSYGIPEMDEKVFLEIKKKWKGVVYKRRISMTLREAREYLDEGKPMKQDGQIEREIDYFVHFYRPKAKMYIAYDREAYFGKEDPLLRITFDQNIRSRREDLKLELGDAGKLLMERGCCLMEIKVSGAFPMWLSHIMSELEIFPASFSKYGNIYKKYAKELTQEFLELEQEQDMVTEFGNCHHYAAAAI